MCAPSNLTSRLPFFASLTHTCKAQMEEDGTVRIAERTVTIDVQRNRGRVLVEVWLSSNEDVSYFGGELSGLSCLSRQCSFSVSQVKAIRAKILAALPA